MKASAILILDRLVARLSIEPLCKTEICAQTFCCVSTAKKRIKLLREAKRVHVAKWDKRANGIVVPYYGAGNQPDAPKPKNFTDKQIRSRYLAKLRKDPERYLRVTRRERIKKIKVPRQPNSWFAALPGASA